MNSGAICEMKTAIYLLVLGVLGLATCSSQFLVGLEDEWSKYKVSYERSYESTEEGLRKIIFMNNLKTIMRHNIEADMGRHTYWMGVNQFTDMSNEELKKLMSGFVLKPDNMTGGSTYLPPANLDAPSAVDWRTKGYVTAVKDQGKCGSCWSFSATGSLEGQHKRKTGKLVNLSEQQLIDCSTLWGNNGCQGGSQCSTFKYVKEAGGLDTEKCYPYTAKDGNCHTKESCIGAKSTGVIYLPRADEDALKAAVASVGPVSVAITVTSNFHYYSHGVYNEPDCSPYKLNHAVLVVGYGSERGIDYWIVKNSWGPQWGLSGFIKMSRNKGNQCGIASEACYPLV
ncbi:procathepsin L-like [Lineus longissimus]|uniref:procathepsin L-like n=1 Tax=Lineus longissimus TaxID=88925 RepID=UPI00315C6DF3